MSSFPGKYNSAHKSIWDAHTAKTIADRAIGTAILQAQHTELRREKEAKILAIELIDYIRHLVSSGMTPEFRDSTYILNN